jgi:hypothetical protein
MPDGLIHSKYYTAILSAGQEEIPECYKSFWDWKQNIKTGFQIEIPMVEYRHRALSKCRLDVPQYRI